MRPPTPTGRHTTADPCRTGACPGRTPAGSGGRSDGSDAGSSPHPSRDERGSGTVLVLTVAALVVLAGTVLASLASVAVARHRAAGAADLAALAAADRAHLGAREACAVAEQVAEAAGASVVTCRLAGDVAEVTAQVRPPGRLGELGVATGRARAGPLELGAGAR